jgi:uncharacterized Zn-binding protein involved in type VI secretion
MPPAARLGDATSHPGVINHPCVRSVLINGRPAAVAGAVHICALPPQAGPHPPNPLVGGSGTVLLGGRPAMRLGDQAACGALIVLGASNVLIGG